MFLPHGAVESLSVSCGQVLCIADTFYQLLGAWLSVLDALERPPSECPACWQTFLPSRIDLPRPELPCSGIDQVLPLRRRDSIQFSLENAVGNEVSLYDTLLAGPVVLVWYRGGWCPYCNLQLKQIQERLADINAAGGQVLAISPELPDKTLTLRERHNLEFNVLSDINNKVADTYKLAYSVADHVVDHYDLSYTTNEYNGEDAQQRLPLAVTYVIDRTGLVEYAFLDADFANRAKPEDVIEVLRNIKNK